MKKDVDGTINNIKGLGNYLGKLATDGDARKAAMKSMGQAWDNMVEGFKKDPAYSLGGAAFDVASMLVGAGEVKVGLSAAKATQGIVRGVSAFSKTVGKAAVKNASAMAKNIAHLATRGPGLAKDIGKGAWAKMKKVNKAFSNALDHISSKFDDAYAYAEGFFSKDFTKHNARVYMPSGSGGGVPKPDVISRLDEVKVEFKRNPKHDEQEFIRQLNGQEEGLNRLTVQEYFDNRERYLTEGRSKEGAKAQRRAREQALEDKIRDLILEGKTPDIAEAEAKEWLKGQAALHDPDQIAGGDPTRITGVGDRYINHSLGAQWKTRVGDMDAQIRELAQGLSPEELKNTYLNISLSH